MALDSAINQHLQSLKASNPFLGRPPVLGHAGLPQPAPLLPPRPGPPAAPGAAQPPGAATLSVAIDNLRFRYQLSEADLRETFQRWGALQSVQVNREGAREVGVVTFAEAIDASDAQRQLHGQICNFEGAAGALAVVAGAPELLSPPVPRPAPTPVPAPALPAPVMQSHPAAMQSHPAAMQSHPAAPPPVAEGQVRGMTAPSMQPTDSLAPPRPPAAAEPMPGSSPMAGAQDVPAPGAPAMPGPPPAAGSTAFGAPLAPAGGPAAGESKGQGKGDQGLPPAANGAQGAGRRPGWCAKVVIQADLLHQEFPTVTKIVGVGNANVDHIRGQTQCSVILRGKGSGHVEAETGQESSEPMFLWLSSDLPQNGKSALEMVQDLLKAVYDEHNSWCQTHGLRYPGFVEPQIIENPPDLGPLGVSVPPPAAPAPAPALPPAPPARLAPPAPPAPPAPGAPPGHSAPAPGMPQFAPPQMAPPPMGMPQGHGDYYRPMTAYGSKGAPHGKGPYG